MNMKPKPLKWHYFMIYFSLWVGAFSTFVEASRFTNGTMYDKASNLIYRAFPYMRWLDISYGTILIITSVYQVVIRFQLANFRNTAPQKLLYLYTVRAVSCFAYMLMATMVTGFSFIQPSNVGAILVYLMITIIWLLINKRYYDNRKELFVN